MYRAKPDEGIVWITGASAGIGRALAVLYAARGYRVVVTARRAEALASLAAETGVTAYPGDVTDAARMAEIVEAIEREQGPIVLAVLNAGVYHPEERRGFDADLVWRTVESNLGGAVRCLDPLLKAMLPRRRGQIAIVASLAGYGGIPGSLAYGSAKAAMINMAEGLRLTYGPRGLTIQVINPGFVETAMTAPNDYPMPFMISAEDAAARIQRGLTAARFEITFPRRLVWTMKLAASMPYALWLPLMRLATKRAHR